MNLEPTRDERGEAPPGNGSARWLRAGLVTWDQARVIERELGPGEPEPAALQGLVDAGVITSSQAAAIRRAQLDGRRGDVRSRGATEPSAAAARQGVRSRFELPRLSLDAGRLGVVLAALAFAVLVWGLAGLVSDLVAAPRKPVVMERVDGMRLLASVLVLIGGRRMYREAQDGKQLILIGLLLYALVTLAAGFRRLADPSVMAVLASCALLYVLTLLSRFGWPRPAEVEADQGGDRAPSASRVSVPQV
jgi:hypothetical protein